MRAIFISYRRDDAEGQAGRLFDDLVKEFGEEAVFMDVAGIKPGLDFRHAIDEQVASCGVLLAVIGKDWLNATDGSGKRRLDDVMDFVRLETASALKRSIPVIPVLVRGAQMPRAEQLPTDMAELAYRNAVELTHARWDSDVQLLVKALRPHVQAIQDPQPRKFPWKIVALSVAAIIVLITGYMIYKKATENPYSSFANIQNVPSDTSAHVDTSTNIIMGKTAGSRDITSVPGKSIKPDSNTTKEQSPPALPAIYTLEGTWEDDDSRMFVVVADKKEKGNFEMEQVKPAKEYDALWKATLDSERKVEINVFAMPSGSHQEHMNLELSLDGNRMAGLAGPGGAGPDDVPPVPIHFRRVK